MPLSDIRIGEEGAREYSKVSYPIRYGTYHEVRTGRHVFQFDLEGRIRHIHGRKEDWPDPAEWLKRTPGNDWVYYSSGEYGATFAHFGEYYLPCPSYPTNSIVGDNPFSYSGVRGSLHALEGLWEDAASRSGLSHGQRRFVERMAEQDGRALARSGRELHSLLGGRVTVLPPDARHADYDVIPLIIADGCMYHCRFCRVKAGKGFTARSREDVARQVLGLKRLYGADTANCNGLFLGYHDSLAAGMDLIEFATERAYKAFRFDRSYMRRPTLYLFGSVDSLLSSSERLFELLAASPFHTYINVGLESADGATLALLGKPVPADRVIDGYSRMLDINRRYGNIEITANFVISINLPKSHIESLLLLSAGGHGPSVRGTIYVSPVVGRHTGREERKSLMTDFTSLKKASPLPTYLYLIQRL